MNRDLVTLQLHIQLGSTFQSIVIASAYCAGDEPTPSDSLVRLAEYCSAKRLPLLLGCDANAHHDVWGSTDTNSRGESFLEFILKYNLEIMNVGNTPTFVTRARQEVLDITLASPSLCNYIRAWQVSPEPSLSDHRIISFDIEDVGSHSEEKRNPRRTDWTLYREHLCGSLSLISTVAKNTDELDRAVERVNESILEAFQESCPLRKRQAVMSTPWWSRELDRLRKLTRRSFNRAKRDGSWEEYRETLNLYNKEIRKAKRGSFRKFCAEISSIPVGARVYRAMANSGTLGASSLRKQDGSYTYCEPERLKLLLETHFPGCTLVGVDEEPPAWKPQRMDWKTAGEICSPRKLEWAIASFDPFKSPGEDRILPAFLKEGVKELLPHLVRICRASLAFGYIPQAWRTARVVFIPKAGKKDMANPRSFRPISLTSFMLKAMEKTVDNHVRTEILVKRPLHPCQHAYRAGRSTDTALYQLSNLLRDAAECKDTALAVFMDIEGCFDNTSHEAIVRALMTRGVAGTVTRWIQAALMSRTAEAQGISVKTTRGCPQGGVLSPLLWSLVVDELLQILTDEGIMCVGYADDVVVVVRGRCDSTLCELLQHALRLIGDWCGTVGLRLNATKTCVVPFTRRRKTNFKQVTINGTPIEWKREVKYLGVTLDSHLNFNQHVAEVTTKATRAMLLCRRLAGKSWGCSPKIMRQLYLTMVRPIILYGCAVWAGGSITETRRNILTKVQRLACVSITGARRSCPTAAMEVILDLPPLHIAVVTSARLAILRIASSSVTRSGRAKERDSSSLATCAYALELPRDRVPPVFCPERRFEVVLSNKRDFCETTVSLKDHTIKWYTDGSKISCGTGAGVYGPRTKYHVAMGKNATIYQAELFALDQCLQMNLDRNYRSRDIAIMSDSQAALRSLTSFVITSKMALECRTKLNELSRLNKVTLVWVPGHIGISGNEAADQLAKRGASSPFIGPEPFCGVGGNFVSGLIKDQAYRDAQEQWDALPGLRQSKALLGNYQKKRSRRLLNLSRGKLRIATGFLSEHCNLRGRMQKLGLADCAMLLRRTPFTSCLTVKL